MDEIIGIAILTEVNPSDGYEYLFVTCHSPIRRTIETSAIPVIERGKPNPGTRGWTYVVKGDYLDVNPSLRMYLPANGSTPEKELFHNGASWSVKFVRKSMDEASDQLDVLNRELRDTIRESWAKKI